MTSSRPRSKSVEQTHTNPKSTDHVSDRQKNKDETLQPVVEDPLQVFEAIDKGLEHILCGLGCAQLTRGSFVVVMIDGCKMLNCQGWWGRFVELGDLVQHFDSFGFSTLAQQEFWRLIKSEDEETKEEDCQCHTSENNALISPTHIA